MMKTRSGQAPTGSQGKARGKPKSGRVAKRPKERASTMVKSKSSPPRKAVAEIREDKRRVKSMSATIKSDINGQVEAKLEREAANRARKEEQAKKAEVVQKVKSPSKIAKTKKKFGRRSDAKPGSTAGNTPGKLRSGRNRLV